MSSIYRAYLDAGRFEEARSLLESELSEARGAGDREREAAALGHLGITCKHMGDYRRAVEYQEQSLDLYRALGDEVEEGHSWGDLGVALHKLGDLDRARECFDRQSSIAQRHGDTHSLITARLNSANLLVSRGHFDEALNIYRDLLPVLEAGSDRLLEADILLNTGNVLYMTGQLESAVELHDKAMEVFREAGAPVREGYAAFALALDRAAMGDVDAAIPSTERARDLLKAAGAPEAGRVQATLDALRSRGQPAVTAPVLDTPTSPDLLVESIDEIGRQGEMRGDTEMLRRASEQYRGLLERPDVVGALRARVLNNLATALRVIGLLSSQAEALEQAVTVYSSVLSEHGGDQSAQDRQGTEVNLAKALVLHGWTGSDTASFQRASKLLRRLVRTVKGSGDRSEVATLEMLRGDALRGLGVHGARKAALCRALATHLSVWEELGDDPRLGAAAREAVDIDLRAIKSSFSRRRAKRCFARHAGRLDRYLKATVGPPP